MKFKMYSLRFVLFICIGLKELVVSVNGDSKNGAVNVKIFPASLAKNLLQTFNNSASLYEEIIYEIDTDLITGFNISVDVSLIDVKTSAKFPVVISIVQRQAVTFMQLPYTYKNSGGRTSAIYTEENRTVCIPNRLDNHERHIFVKISTGSVQPIKFLIKMTVNDTLQLKENETSTFVITPLSPTFVHFPFQTNTSENVVVRVLSSETYCMAVAIEEPKCPAFDGKDSFGLGSRWEIMSQKGAIRVNMRDYLKGFNIKLMLLHDDSLCGMTSDISQNRSKTVWIQVENDLIISTSNGYFWIAIGVPPLVSLFVGLIAGGTYIISYSMARNKMVSCRTQNTNKEVLNLVSLQKFSGSNPESSGPASYGKWTLFVSIFFAIPIIDQSIYNALASRGSGVYGVCSHSDLCSHPFWIFKDFNHLWSNVCYLVLGFLFIFITAMKKCIKETQDATEGVQFNVGLYYSMGLALMMKGVLSTAYHLCPNKSNFQYDLTYLSIVIVICFLKVLELRRPKALNAVSPWSCGILGMWLLISTLGLMFERYAGETSEAFWIFRIVVAVIQGVILFYASIYAIYIGYPINRFPKVMEKESVPLQQRMMISELRHQQAPPTPKRETNDGDSYEKSFMKYMSDIPRFLFIFPKLWHWKLPVGRPERWIYVFFMLTLNGYLIYYSMVENYTLYGLLYLAANFGLNLVYYFIMKVVFGEFKIFSWKSIQVFVYLLFAILFGAFALDYFLKNAQEWTEPDTQAREGDEDCIWFPPFPFYDKHDAWHMLSAHALFFVFMTLLSIDDGVEGIGRDFLAAF